MPNSKRSISLYALHLVPIVLITVIVIGSLVVIRKSSQSVDVLGEKESKEVKGKNENSKDNNKGKSSENNNENKSSSSQGQNSQKIDSNENKNQPGPSKKSEDNQYY